MKNTSLVIKSMMVLVSVFCLIARNGSLEAWAKGPGGSHRSTSNITQPGNTQGSPGASSGNSVQDSTQKGAGSKASPDLSFKFGTVFTTKIHMGDKDDNKPEN
jgi:hypothetical protein